MGHPLGVFRPWPIAATSPTTVSKGGDVRFAPAVLLTKREAFEVCEACAEGERALLRSGRPAEAGRLAALFELIEEKLISE